MQTFLVDSCLVEAVVTGRLCVVLQWVLNWFKLKLLVKQLFCVFVEIIYVLGVDG